jgi:hypothetical protein
VTLPRCRFQSRLPTIPSGPCTRLHAYGREVLLDKQWLNWENGGDWRSESRRCSEFVNERKGDLSPTILSSHRQLHGFH